jgi:hypothetical protein
MSRKPENDSTRPHDCRHVQVFEKEEIASTAFWLRENACMFGVYGASFDGRSVCKQVSDR